MKSKKKISRRRKALQMRIVDNNFCVAVTVALFGSN